MKTKIISFLIVFFSLLTVFSSCNMQEDFTSEQTTNAIVNVTDSMTELASETVEEITTLPDTDIEKTENDFPEIDYSKFVIICDSKEFVAKYGTDYKKVESEEEFNEVFGYYSSFDNYVRINIICNQENIESKLLNIRYSYLYKYVNGINIVINESDFDVQAIIELAQDKEIVEIQFYTAVAVDE